MSLCSLRCGCVYLCVYMCVCACRGNAVLTGRFICHNTLNQTNSHGQKFDARNVRQVKTNMTFTVLAAQQNRGNLFSHCLSNASFSDFFFIIFKLPLMQIFAIRDCLQRDVNCF